MNDIKFSWVQTHFEIVEYLASKENSQIEIIELLKSVGITGFDDEDENGKIELTEIDPFTFFCYINKYGSEKRLQFLQKIAEKIGLTIPLDEKGLPSAQPQKVWIFPYKKLRTNNEINRLWSFFYKAIDGNIKEVDFQDVLKIKGVGKTKLTEILFYVKPKKYLPINGPTKPYIQNELNLSSDFNSYQEYISLLDKISIKTKMPFYEFSYFAWEWKTKKKGEISKNAKGELINMKEKFISFLNKNNRKGSQKASSYIRALELLDNILNTKAKSKLEGFKSIYDIDSIKTIKKLHKFVLKEQKTKIGIFENEEPISYWRDRFYSAAINSYLDFLNQNYNNKTYDILPKVEQKNFEISNFENTCKNSGLIYSQELITRYIASLATKPFVLLSGLSGSGKTKLAEAFAKWICENDEQYALIPVGADWTNREPLLGYVNALDNKEYVLPENGALKLLIEANKEKNKNKPYFLILDEMNLSHVERYFADFLSVMESKNEFKLHSSEANLNITDGEKFKDATEVPNALTWPKNLYVIGTVNIDETTYMFSPKVLDRANVIEFRVSDTDLNDYFESEIPLNMKMLLMEDEKTGLGASYGQDFVLKSNEDLDDATKKIRNKSLEKLNDELKAFFSALQKVGAEFGYRTAREIQTLFEQIESINPNLKEIDLFSDVYPINDNFKIDVAIMQKLLPKLHGSRNKLVDILKVLANLCLEEKLEDDKKDKIFDILKKEDPKSIYPISLNKITRMYNNVIANGFTSYAEA